jgi:RNA polymerase sigma factor (sigma-70 family)
MSVAIERVPPLSFSRESRSDSDRFAELVEPHYPALYRVAYRLTRSTHDAEDLAQETCVRAFSRLDVLERLELPRGWLLRVLYRLFVDASRRYERKHVDSLDGFDDVLVSEQPGPAEEADRALDRERLDIAWRYLDEEQQALLALHDIEGHSLAELREITGLKEGTLKSRLHRARVRLGKLLQGAAAASALAREGRSR